MSKRFKVIILFNLEILGESIILLLFYLIIFLFSSVHFFFFLKKKSYEWGGDWSDNSPLWTESLKKAVNFVAADDGSFWMSFKDFTNEYSQVFYLLFLLLIRIFFKKKKIFFFSLLLLKKVGICKTVPSTWSSAFCEGQWVPGATSGGSSEVSGHFNPTYEITNEDSHVWLQLEQVSFSFLSFFLFLNFSLFFFFKFVNFFFFPLQQA